MSTDRDIAALPSVFGSAGALATAIRDGRTTSRALLEAYLERIERFNPALNAIIHLDAPAARERADAADAALRRGERWGPLHGVPISVKESHNVAGWPTTYGDPRHRDNRPGTNAAIIDRLLDAGAIIIGKTNVPIGLLDWQSYNAIHGTTHNPWRPGHTPGGSSGGSAAALAAGLAAAELGSDAGGSIRFPAHFNGVFGHRPSVGIVPHDGNLLPGAVLAGDYAVSGPLARSAADLELFLDVITAPPAALAKAWSLAIPPARSREPGGFRVAALLDSDVAPIDRSYADALNGLLARLRQIGVAVDEEARPDIDFHESYRLFAQLVRSKVGRDLSDEDYAEAVAAAGRLAKDDGSFPALALRATTQSHRDYSFAAERRAAIQAAWAAFFERYDVLLAPVTLSAAFPIDEARPRGERRLAINGEAVPYDSQIFWAGLASLAGLPVSVAPIGLTAEGLPVGVQIIGPYLEDRTPIAFAAAVEALHGFRIPPGFE